MIDAEKLRAFIAREWDEQGMCKSCGWHAALREYDHDNFYVNVLKGRIEASCLGDSEDSPSHRGVRIYFASTEAFLNGGNENA